MLPALSQHSTTSTPAACAALVSTEGRVLPLAGATIRAEAGGGIVRVRLEQRFRNVHEVPLRVTYTLPLPADAAVSGFSFRIGEQRIVGEIDRREAARKRFEEAILNGHAAALLEQERSSLFTQELGNIPAGAEVVADIEVDQRLRWLAEGAWEWRFPTTVGPRYLGAPGRVPDAERLAVPIEQGPIEQRPIEPGPITPRLTFQLGIRDALARGRAPESPSHALRVTEAEVRSLDAGTPFDRDVVVRWAVATESVQARIETARRASVPDAASDTAHGLLTLLPPLTPASAIPRDVVVLLDTSGSMSGEPLAQACRILSALIDTLGDADQLELIQFSSAPRRWRPAPLAVTPAVKREALEWLGSRSAGGGTEMRAGIEEALAARRSESQRQVLLVTDGFIGFEAEVVGAIAAREFRATRVHTIGVGSAVNRSLTSAAARAGGGTEHVVGLGEDAEPAARRIVAATDAPLVVDLELTGSAFLAHAGLPDLFAGQPALIPLQLRASGGELCIRGRTAAGLWQQTLALGAVASGSGRAELVALYGRERVEQLEVRAAAGQHVDAEIERAGLDYRIATRLTSWVAVSETPCVDPQSPLRRERMPHALPHGVSAEALGLRAAVTAGAMASAAPMLARARLTSPLPSRSVQAPRLGIAPSPRSLSAPGFVRRLASAARGAMPKGKPRGPESAERGRRGTPAAPTLRGHVVRRDAAQLVIEIEIDDTLAWEQPSAVVMHWSDGSEAPLALDSARSTRAATLHAGERARLVLAVSAVDATKSARALRLTLGGRERHVQL
jgi:Ca-activated chloride channel homolog